MAANKRLYYAVQQVGVSRSGVNTFTSIHGLQSVGINTKFNLEQVFEIGQLAIYENIENIPDVEVTLEKVLDGYPPIYLLCTNGSASPSLAGRQNLRPTIGLSIYSDAQDAASGTPLAQCVVSGMFVSALSYNLQVQGNFTESVTLVGNNKWWNQTFTANAFTNTDSPLAITGSGGVNRREDLLLGEAAGITRTLLPADIPGVTSSGTVSFSTTLDEFSVHLQSIKVSTNLGRENMFELGRRGVYHRYIQFPVQVKCDIEMMSQTGDQITAYENTTTTAERVIYISCREGTKLDLGSKNRLESVSYGGANAGQNGGNATNTYSFTNFNDLSVTHPQDPSGLS